MEEEKDPKESKEVIIGEEAKKILKPKDNKEDQEELEEKAEESKEIISGEATERILKPDEIRVTREVAEEESEQEFEEEDFKEEEVSEAEHIVEKDKKYICLVDNYPRGFPTDRIVRLEKILENMIADVHYKTIHYSEFDSDIAKNSIGVILSGSSFNVSDFYYVDRLLRRFEPEIEFIRNNPDKPTLGLCFGHQLVGYAYGAQVSRMRISGLGGGIIFITLKKTDELISKENIPVNIHHRDFLSPNDCNIRKNFEILAKSKTKRYRIVQYMKHRDRPLFTVQFHPETHFDNYFHPNLFDNRIVTKTKLIGEEIIENFVWRCLYESSTDG
ncbi:MAG: hypothetical protein GF383_02930 [Candidatus Lokiarchaeota archaeon]|nr:hypothetical protein [Candidatus Lokiarchaeota archaeon]MBD3338471.1 hypothetical protein [Candidatus Lokiarchaeota archaeon]